jgi:hypothetical protein
MGEEVEWMWVNEWLEGTKIGDNTYTQMRPIPYASKSLVNKSKGTPPYVGTVYSTNDYRVQSLTDIMKPLAYSYDIAYYKRELEIATYKGNFAAINASMVPSGWDPKEWIRYVTVNKFGWLDPTNEILKGPSQGKLIHLLLPMFSWEILMLFKCIQTYLWILRILLVKLQEFLEPEKGKSKIEKQ